MGAESPPKHRFYVFTVTDCCGDFRNVRGSDDAVGPGRRDPEWPRKIPRGAPGPVNACCGPRGALIFIENGRFCPKKNKNGTYVRDGFSVARY